MLTVFTTGTKTVQSATLQQAAEAVQAATRKMGSTRWYGTGSQAGIVMDGSNVVARVSYNGRVWDAAGCEMTV